MRATALLLPAVSAAAILFAFRQDSPSSHDSYSDAIALKAKTVVRCTPDWNAIIAQMEETDIPPIPGAGIYKWKITTGNDSAQFYFNQGINMYYSFHIIEAMASFKKAAKFDPQSAMLHWAQALAMGPNINDVGYTASPEALAASSKAVELSTSCTAKEKLLIEAQAKRYSSNPSDTREALNQVYADRMKEAYATYPADADIAALYADALMLQHPWDLWYVNGTPKAWTPVIREVLEKLLAKTPDHPGANHYYIHVMEPSPYAAKALPSADRLGKLTPGLSHTVHMPSHIYLRTGQYDKGVTVNENAVNSYQKAMSLYDPAKNGHFLYAIHNIHMQTNNAMMAGRKEYSIRSADQTQQSVPAEYLQETGAMGNYIQYIYLTPVLTDIRFGNWDKLLATAKPSSQHVYATLLWWFGQGMAHAGKSDMIAAANDLKELRSVMKDSVLYMPLSPFSAAIEGARAAENILAGMIALKQGQYTAAVANFQTAVKTEDSMVYNEPRDWLLNPRHYLGYAYLAMDNAAAAEKVYKRDLDYNNNNIWSVQGLYESLLRQKKNTEAMKLKPLMEKLQAGSDSKPGHSIPL